ncbi:hypothetical protein ILUMI_00654 [Ignelater luminosus]|uniref:non-specific serine/threonine protein kinase n=1 Tax=Ignelater luminosus TaxID=2038154 RepID=A0A8K0GMX6_IGNLU|nr:hypothetical protein ILUMI_00654 [Ignelater luminosus]
MVSRKSNLEGYERIKAIGKGKNLNQITISALVDFQINILLGAFGTAILYRRLSDNKDVVIKEIFLSDMSDAEKQLAFNEADVLASLNHPNIIRYVAMSRINLKQVPAYMGSFERDGSLLIEMEYADNGNLAQLINLRRERKKMFKEKDILECEGKEYDEKSDIWAVGCILYELACFHKPFEAPNLPALVQRISACEYNEIPDIYSKNLSQLIAEILQKDYMKRPSAQYIHDHVIPSFLQFSNLRTESRRHSLKSPVTKDNNRERSVLYHMNGFGDNLDLSPIELPLKKIINFSASITHFMVVTIGQCAAGDGFSVFLNKSGLIYTCGDGRQGCLGHGNWNSILRPTIIDSLITTNIVHISCGSKHVLALTADGKVYSWGSSSNGQLGLGHEKFCCMPTLIKLPNEYLITNIFAENNSSALLDDSGKILVCGDNTHNKLGVRNETKLLNFQILRILKDKIINVSMGLNHTILVTQNGKTIGMGKNTEGQLGIGNCTTYSYPQTANTPQNIVMVSCGATFTVAATDNNVVYFWGTYHKENSSVTSSELPEKFPHYSHSAISHKNNMSIQKIPAIDASLTDISNVVDSGTPEIIKKPKSILALYASNEKLKAGQKIWLEKVQALSNSLMILVHTTAPPPLRKTQSVDSTYSSNRHSSSSANVPDWMDTNLDYSALTTLPNTAEFA